MSTTHSDSGSKDRIVLAYSGGLDTSVAIGWLGDQTGADVVAVAIDVGQGGEDLETVRKRALECGAVEAVVVDARDEFAEQFCLPALQATMSPSWRTFLIRRSTSLDVVPQNSASVAVICSYLPALMIPTSNSSFNLPFLLSSAISLSALEKSRGRAASRSNSLATCESAT